MGEGVDEGVDVGQGEGKGKGMGKDVSAADRSVLVGAGLGVPVGAGLGEAWCPSWRRVGFWHGGKRPC